MKSFPSAVRRKQRLLRHQHRHHLRKKLRKVSQKHSFEGENMFIEVNAISFPFNPSALYPPLCSQTTVKFHFPSFSFYCRMPKNLCYFQDPSSSQHINFRTRFILTFLFLPPSSDDEDDRADMPPEMYINQKKWLELRVAQKSPISSCCNDVNIVT